MDNTTPSAIISALESTITGLTPSGSSTIGTQGAYAVLEEQSYSEEGEEQAESDIDRQFVIQNFTPQEVAFPCRSTHNQWTARFEVAIGHQVTADYGAGRDRRDLDCQQLIQKLIHVNSRPTGVAVIRFRNMQSTIEKQGQFFWTILTFEIVYYVLTTYGS